MKVLIQNAQSGEYLTQNGTWTPLPSHGKDFRYTSCARAVLRKENTSHLRVLFYFENFDYSICARRSERQWSVADMCAPGVDF